MNDLNSPAKNNIEVTELFHVAFRVFQERPGLIIGGTAFLNLVPFVAIGIPMLGLMFAAGLTSALSSSTPDFAKMMSFLSVIILGAPILIAGYTLLRTGWFSICLKLISHEEVAFSEFKAALPKFLPFLGVQVLMMIAIGIGTICLIIPGIFLSVKFAFAPFLVLDKGLGPIEALKESWNLVTGYSWQVFLLGAAYFIASTIAGIIPLIGMLAQLLAMSYYDLLLAAAYKGRDGTLELSA